MCRSCGQRHNSVVADTSPSGDPGPDGSIDSVSSAGYASGWREAGGSGSSGAAASDGGGAWGSVAGWGVGVVEARGGGLTMKEYDQHLNRLSKENFALKVRVYFLEEQQGQQATSAPQLHKTNIELKVENESLKRSVYEKQQLLRQASSALTQLEDEYKDQLTGLVREHEDNVHHLQDTIDQLNKRASEYAARCSELEAALLRHQRTQEEAVPSSELSQLCALAFPTANADAVPMSKSNAGGDWTNAPVWGPNAAAGAASEMWAMWNNPSAVSGGQAGNLPPTPFTTATDGVIAAEVGPASDQMQQQSYDVFPQSQQAAQDSSSSVFSSSEAGDGDHQLRKMSTDSQSSQFSANTNPFYGIGAANNNINGPSSNASNGSSAANDQNGSSNNTGANANQPVHINTTNVTHNNINNTVPNTSNNVQHMAYQPYHHPPSQQQQHAYPQPNAASYQPNNEPNYHQSFPQHQNNQPNALVPATVTAGAASINVLPASNNAQQQLQNETSQQAADSSRIAELEREISVLMQRVHELQLLLQNRDSATSALHEDIDNLKKELADKEVEAVEREEKMDSLTQELETRHRQLQTKDNTITSLSTDLHRVEPEISVKVQEIVERDRIIEEKIEQIEQQNKILVEIQITLDEKQKQIAELESNLSEARERVQQLERDYDKSCVAINGFITDVSAKDKELVSLKKELRKREKKIKDLIAELKETLDMLGKAKWEAETGGCAEDSVKDMTEEENERLWAEMEQRKLEVANLKAELSQTSQCSEQLTQCKEALMLKEQQEKELQQQLTQLNARIADRDFQLVEHSSAVGELKSKLEAAKSDLTDRKLELNQLRAIATDAAQLKEQLDKCHADKNREVQSLEEIIELKNSDILHLQSQLITEAGRKLPPKSDITVAQAQEACSSPSVTPCSAPSASIITTTTMPPMQFNITSVAPVHHETVHSTDAGVASNNSAARKDSGSSFQEQLDVIRRELKETRESIGCELVAAGIKKNNYPEIVNKYRIECNKLRKRLSESNNACDLLKNRLEELAEFLEQILDMDERGLIDLSKLSCGMTREDLCKSLNDSRALSQTLSQSLLSGMDTLMEEELLDVLSETADDSVMFIPDHHQVTSTSSLLGYTRHNLMDDTYETVASNAPNESIMSLSHLMIPSDTNYRELADKLCSDVHDKIKQLDDILVQVEHRSIELDRKETELTNQSDYIEALREKITLLEMSVNKSVELKDIAVPEDNIDAVSDSSSSVHVACQTLLAMAPRQSVCSLAELSTPYLSSCSDSFMQNSKASTVKETDNNNVESFQESESASTRNCVQEKSNVHNNLLPSSSVLQRSATDIKTTNLSNHSQPRSKSGCVSAGEMQQQPHHVPISPSESEAWSEPDRNVSLARIGLETCTFAASLERASSRSRQTRASAAAACSSESDTEECAMLPDDNASMVSNCNAVTGSNMASISNCNTGNKPQLKRKSDASEVRRLASKLRTMEHLNETLKAELNIYQSLSHQLSPTTDQQQSDHKSCNVRHNFSSATNENGNQDGNNNPRNSVGIHEGVTIGTPPTNSNNFTSPRSSVGKKMRRLPSAGCEESLALAAPLLQEIRSLRTKLEESISNNDQLRDQLEAAVLSCSRASDDPQHLTHLTHALLNAQETLQLTREKLSFAQRCEQVQADRCCVSERRTEEELKTSEQLRENIRNTQQQVAASIAQGEAAQATTEKHMHQLRDNCEFAEVKLQEAKRLHEESEAVLQDRLTEVTKACEESEARLAEQHEAINEVYSSLQETSHWPHLNHLHSALQASETQVLKVTRDRLVLLGEKSKLQAQLLSAQAQTSLLQDSLCEDETAAAPGLHQQLNKVQNAVRNLQDQCSKLQYANATLGKEKEHLEEKLAGYRAVEKLANKSDITLETVKDTGSRLNIVALQQLQRNHSLLQQDYSHLQKQYNLLQEEEKRMCQKLHVCNIALHKAQLNIDILTEQYQDKMQLLQKECNEKLLDTEGQLNNLQSRYQERIKATEDELMEVQKRSQERIKSTEDKLVEVQNQYENAEVKFIDQHSRRKVAEDKLMETQKRYQDKLSIAETHSSEESTRLENKLHQLLQQLDSERKTCESQRAELRTLRQRNQQLMLRTGAWAAENKENLHHPYEASSPRKSLQQHTRSTVNLSTEVATSSYGNSPRHDPTMLLGSGPLSGGGFGASSLLRSPQRSLHFSDPNLGLYATREELEGVEEDFEEELLQADSPDLGLGSSDNGQMSSLERVTFGGRSYSGQQKHNHTIGSEAGGSKNSSSSASYSTSFHQNHNTSSNSSNSHNRNSSSSNTTNMNQYNDRSSRRLRDSFATTTSSNSHDVTLSTVRDLGGCHGNNSTSRHNMSYISSSARDINNISSANSMRSTVSCSPQQPIGVLISSRPSLPKSLGSPPPHPCSVPSHNGLMNCNAELSSQVETLSTELRDRDARLTTALQQLASATARKQTVERAMCRQLTKTHQVLKMAKGNLRQHRDAAASNPQERQGHPELQD